jgi:flagellar hook assembly protein FlgD
MRSAPNPFHPRTTIHFSVPVEADVEVAVHDLQGRTVARLVSERKTPGVYQVAWDGTDGGGRRIEAGTYFVRLMAETVRGRERFVETGKVTLVR